MELWVRSQDKELLVPIKEELKLLKGRYVQSTISSYQPQQLYEISYKENMLGEYKTKERALEVLDEIQHIIKQQLMFHIDKSQCNTIEDIANPKFIIRDVGIPRIYEMPKE